MNRDPVERAPTLGSTRDMHVHEIIDEPDAGAQVSTGNLPELDTVQSMMHSAHRRYEPLDEGSVADYIPVLAAVPPDLFGLAIASADGRVGLATFSPRLDTAGNSVRGQHATKFLSELLGLNILASAPAPAVGR